MSFAAIQYQQTRVSTASPVQVVISLYEGAIRFLKEAILAQGAHELGRRGVALSRAHAIVTELRVTLDHDRAPELSAQLDGLYDFVIDRINAATRGGDAALVEPALRVLTSLHSAWVEISRRSV
ncbi:MAG: flagellar export chaperone FliS [Sandaracinus sp.]